MGRAAVALLILGMLVGAFFAFHTGHYRTGNGKGLSTATSAIVVATIPLFVFVTVVILKWLGRRRGQ